MTTTDLDHTRLPEPAASRAPAPSLVDLLDAAITRADEQRAELAEAEDLEGLAHGLHAARQIRSRLAMLIDLIDADVSNLVLARDKTDRTPIIDGLGALETRRRSTRTRWDSELLFGRLVDRICDTAVVDPETGEKIGDPATAGRIADLLRDYLAAAIPLTPSMGWRIGGLKDAGIDPEQFRTREHGPYTTRVIGPEEAR